MRATRTLPSSLRLIGQCLLLGFFLTPVMAVGQAPDFAETLRLAQEGNAASQFNLGWMYDNGEGVPRDDAEAIRWFRLAADQGNAVAQYNLGLMYATGEGVPINYVTAYAWFNIAAASGNEKAISNRSIAEQLMTPSQISEAQQLSTEIYERIQQGN